MKRRPGDPLIDPEDFWVFGYASLMWRPGFAFAEARPAVLEGYRRDMCFLSVHYRGTPEAPGLVCGLMPAAGPASLCKGLAYRIAPENIDTVVAYLDARELITEIYIPRHLEIALEGRPSALARIYVADITHEQFVGDWSDDKKAAALITGVGTEGRALDYLANVVAHLGDLGIEDPHVSDLLRKARMLEQSRS